MRRKLLEIGSMLAAAIVLGSIPGFSMVMNRLTADVPFSFTVGSTTLPAGRYEISPHPVSTPYVLVIQQINGDHLVQVASMPVSSGIGSPHRSELVFDKVGDREFLRQVWQRGMLGGDEFPKPKAERELLAQAGESHLTHVEAFPVGTR